MAYMKKNINIGLLLLITAALISFASFTVYYQTTFTNLSENYNKKISEMEQLATKLYVEKIRLNETSYQLQIKEEREQDLAGRYTEVRDERDKFKSEYETTKSALKEKSDELEASKTQLSQAQAELATVKADLEGKESKISSLSNQVNNLKGDVDSLQSQKSALCTAIKVYDPSYSC